VTIASARDEIRRRRHLTPIGVDPLLGPWRCLSTDGSYAHEIHMDNAAIVCSTCRRKYGRGQCWATNRVRQSLGLARGAPPEPDPGSWRAAFEEHQHRHHANGRDHDHPASKP
jgi:hypothetical protein